MSAHLVQQVIVGIIVAAALLHFCSKYLPAAWRQQIVYFLTRRGYDQTRLAALFKTKSSCGDGCASCGSCETPAPSGAADGAGASTSSPSSSSSKAQRVIPLRVQR
ncbi:DUF6587 family protein [Rugamonas sp.]|uniref:DUF6587 family protein n=1 Tax=Rugamonas sp. TaxID=1926287 RepID=UPI0025E4ED1A|nr:DUF6587 family protein [Rugamonas sp.]